MEFDMPNITTADIIARVKTAGECWMWQGSIQSAGYGKLSRDGREILAHRASYEAHVGPIPPGFVIDHLCRVRACVNPAHLEPVTNRENIMRGASPVVRQAAQTHCIRGHAFTAENTKIKHGKRMCRECDRAYKRRHRALPGGAAGC